MKRLLKCYVLTLHKLFRLSLAALMLLAGLFLAYEMKRSYDRPPYDGDETRKGNLNGIPIGIPRKYLYYFPVEYIDKSIWEPPKPGDIAYGERTYDHQIAAFSLYLHWPDRQPKNGHNFVSYINGNHSIDDGWLMISIQAQGFTRHPRPPKAKDNGNARVLKGRIKRLAERPVDGGPWRQTEKVRVHYELQGVDIATGLQWAVPVGPYTELYHTWNDALYWQGDKETVVTDLISCYNGKMSNPKSYHKCEHYFEYPEMKTYVNLSYPRNWLPRWRELKAESKMLLQSFIVNTQAAPNDHSEIR